MDDVSLILFARSQDLVAQMKVVFSKLPVFSSTLGHLINPESDVLEELASSRRCLFFVELQSLSDQNGMDCVNEIHQRFRPMGHQLVLIVNSGTDFLDLAIHYEAGNILFWENLEPTTVGALVRRLMGSDFFGFAPFFPNSWPVYEQQVSLTGTVNRNGLVEALFHGLLDHLDGLLRHRFLSQMSELLTNAFAYGVLGITPEERDGHILYIPSQITIPVGREVVVSVVCDEEKYGISVKDPGGALTLLRVLQKLRRHSLIPGRKSPLGVSDLTGRGLFIVSRQTRLVINVLRGVQTEVILLSYFQEERNRYQSLIINEKYPMPET